MRLPSFNDFSPGIIGDVRKPLRTVLQHAPDMAAIVAEWDQDFFNSADNKRASTNIPATLTNLGLMTREPLALTPAGEAIASAATELEAARLLCKHVVETRNGMAVIDAVRSLNSRGESVTKDSLKRELERLGIKELSNATTDHTTLRNWMIAAGLFDQDGREAPIPNEAVMKAVLGVSASERAEWADLPLDQQIFVQVLRRVVESDPKSAMPTKRIIDECLRDHRARFDEDQVRAKVIRPLADAGWIEIVVSPSAGAGGRGGKSGSLRASAKLLGIPLAAVVPDFDQVVPADLRARIDLPREEVHRLLFSADKGERGLGLELLALRMILDMGLEPRAFRLRSRDTAHAEVDLTAEGKALLFSRWNFQCKNVAGNVALSDVAKEVGLAIYSRAHVVAVVTTGGFSSEALAYAREVTASTHLQFLLVPGTVVKDYLAKGPTALIDYVATNAASVMAQKRGQPLATNADD